MIKRLHIKKKIKIELLLQQQKVTEKVRTIFLILISILVHIRTYELIGRSNIYIYIHTYIHTYMHTYVHTYHNKQFCVVRTATVRIRFSIMLIVAVF